jgi:hypothetical protein
MFSPISWCVVQQKGFYVLYMEFENTTIRLLSSEILEKVGVENGMMFCFSEKKFIISKMTYLPVSTCVLCNGPIHICDCNIIYTQFTKSYDDAMKILWDDVSPQIHIRDIHPIRKNL